MTTPLAVGAEALQLQPTSCPICGPRTPYGLLYPANVQLGDLRPEIFSARRPPDRIHYRMLSCHGCGLVRSDPVADAGALAELYRRSSFSYGEETDNLRVTYRRYLDRLDLYLEERSRLLEVGCGSGFFLEEALEAGYEEVRGVEPSLDAADSAATGVASAIVRDVMRDGLFPPGWFHVVCMFQVLDHITDPVRLLADCRRVLRPGGALLCLHHDVGALSARVLGERSPIVDIEHAFLYSRETTSRLLAGAGFEVLEAGRVTNTLSLRHLLHLLPMSRFVRRGLLGLARGLALDGARLRLPLGNLYAIARPRS